MTGSWRMNWGGILFNCFIAILLYDSLMHNKIIKYGNKILAIESNRRV